MDWKDSQIANPGLDPFQSEFLAKDELVSIVPKISTTTRFGLFTSPSTPALHQGADITVPIWVALELKRKNQCALVPPAWLNESILTQIWTHEKANNDSLLPISFFWQEISKLYLVHAGDDLGTPQQRKDLSTILRSIEDVRANKIMHLTKTIDFLSDNDIPVFLIPNITAGEIVRFRSYLLSQINELMSIYKSFNGVLNTRTIEDQARHDKFYILLKKQEEEQQRKKKTSELLARSALLPHSSTAPNFSMNSINPINLSSSSINPSNSLSTHTMAANLSTPFPHMPYNQHTNNDDNDTNTNTNDNTSTPTHHSRNKLAPFNTESQDNSKYRYQSPTRRTNSSQPTSPFKRSQALSQHLNPHSGFFNPPQSPVSGRVTQAALQSLSPSSHQPLRLSSPNQTPQHNRTFEASQEHLNTMIQSLQAEEDKLNSLPPSAFQNFNPSTTSTTFTTSTTTSAISSLSNPRFQRLTTTTRSSQQINTSQSHRLAASRGPNSPNSFTSSSSNTPPTPTNSLPSTHRFLRSSLQQQLDADNDPPTTHHSSNTPASASASLHSEHLTSQQYQHSLQSSSSHNNLTSNQGHSPPVQKSQTSYTSQDSQNSSHLPLTSANIPPQPPQRRSRIDLLEYQATEHSRQSTAQRGHQNDILADVSKDILISDTPDTSTPTTPNTSNNNNSTPISYSSEDFVMPPDLIIIDDQMIITDLQLISQNQQHKPQNQQNKRNPSSMTTSFDQFDLSIIQQRDQLSPTSQLFQSPKSQQSLHRTHIEETSQSRNNQRASHNGAIFDNLDEDHEENLVANQENRLYGRSSGGVRRTASQRDSNTFIDSHADQIRRDERSSQGTQGTQDEQ